MSAREQLREIRRMARRVVVLGRGNNRDTYVIGSDSMKRLFDAIFQEA